MNLGVAQDSTAAATPVENSDAETPKGNQKRQDLFYFDLNWDRLLGLDQSIDQRWFGRGLAFGGMYEVPFNKGGNFSFGIGVGFASHNYYTNAVVTRFDSAGVNYSQFSVVGDTIKDRGKLSLNYVDLPLELRFRTNPNKKGYQWKLAIGAKLGYLVNAHEKIIDKDKIKVKVYDYPNVTQWRYGVTGRIGYGKVMLSGFYSLSPLFEDGTSTQTINQFSLGISIMPF